MNSPIFTKIKQAFSTVPKDDITDIVKARKVKTEMVHMMGTAVQLFDRQEAPTKLVGDAVVSLKGTKCSIAFGTCEGKRKAVVLSVSMDDQGPAYQISGKSSCTTRTQETAFSALMSEITGYLKTT